MPKGPPKRFMRGRILVMVDEAIFWSSSNGRYVMKRGLQWTVGKPHPSKSLLICRLFKVTARKTVKVAAIKNNTVLTETKYLIASKPGMAWIEPSEELLISFVTIHQWAKGVMDKIKKILIVGLTGMFGSDCFQSVPVQYQYPIDCLPSKTTSRSLIVLESTVVLQAASTVKKAGMGCLQ